MNLFINLGSLYFYFNGLLIIDFLYKITQSPYYLLSIFITKGIKRTVVSWMGSIFSISLTFVLLHGILIGRNDMAGELLLLKP